jgi:hypothetical protein
VSELFVKKIELKCSDCYVCIGASCMRGWIALNGDEFEENA